VVLDLDLFAEQRCSGLKLALSDVAPGALNVGPDVYFDCFAHRGFNLPHRNLFPLSIRYLRSPPLVE